MSSFFVLSQHDDWTPQKGYQLPLRAAPKPIVARERVMPLVERVALAEQAKREELAAEEAARETALKRRKDFVESLEQARERVRKEYRETQEQRLEEIRIATLGRLSLIVCEVAAEFGITREMMRSESRSTYLTEPRRKAAWRIWREEGASFAQIGRALNRDHTTAIHMIGMYAGPRGLPMPPACVNHYARELRRAEAAAERRAAGIPAPKRRNRPSAKALREARAI